MNKAEQQPTPSQASATTSHEVLKSILHQPIGSAPHFFEALALVLRSSEIKPEPSKDRDDSQTFSQPSSQ